MGADGAHRTIEFAGRCWWVKQATEPVGPGPNRFDDSPAGVEVTDDGGLVLRVRRVGGVWRCAEVVGAEPTGFGTYEWTVHSDLRAMPRDVVCGMFTWSDDPAHANRELDIEVSAWGERSGVVGTFVVQRGPAGDHHRTFVVPPPMALLVRLALGPRDVPGHGRGPVALPRRRRATCRRCAPTPQPVAVRRGPADR